MPFSNIGSISKNYVDTKVGEITPIIHSIDTQLTEITQQLPKGRSDAVIVAAYNSTDAQKSTADYVCDGTDDNVEIQAAIDSLPTVISTYGEGNSKVGRVHLLSGVYNISDTTNITTNGVELSGAGQSVNAQYGATILHQADGVNLANILDVSGKNAILHDFFVDGNLSNNPTAQDGIYIHSDDCSVSRVSVENSKRDGFKISCWSGYFENMNSEYNGEYGFCISSTHSTFVELSSAQNGVAGIVLYGGMLHQFFGCWSSTDKIGFLLTATAEGMSFLGCSVYNSTQDAVQLNGSYKNTFIGGNIYQSGMAANDTYYGFKLSAFGANNSVNNTFIGNTIYSDAANKPKYGFYESDANQDSNIYIGNQIFNCATNTMLIQGANSTVLKNGSYITDNSGTATVANGATSVVVAHGLSITPSINNISVTPINNIGSATKYWVSNVTSSQFTINVDADPGETTATFVWQIKS